MIELQKFLNSDFIIDDNGIELEYESLLFRKDSEGVHLYINIGNGMQEVLSDGVNDVVNVGIRSKI